jgi:hypothetical protein
VPILAREVAGERLDVDADVRDTRDKWEGGGIRERGGGGAARRVLVAVDDEDEIGCGRIFGDVGTDWDEVGRGGERREVADDGLCGSFGGGLCFAIAFSQSFAIELAVVGLMEGVVDTSSNDSPRLIESLSSPNPSCSVEDEADWLAEDPAIGRSGVPPSDDRDTEWKDDTEDVGACPLRDELERLSFDHGGYVCSTVRQFGEGGCRDELVSFLRLEAELMEDMDLRDV